MQTQFLSRDKIQDVDIEKDLYAKPFGVPLWFFFVCLIFFIL